MRGYRRKQIGLVTSDKMDKTVVVEVKNTSLDRRFRKYIEQVKKYKAHSPNNDVGIGDLIEIVETSPISKEKKWTVSKVLRKSTYTT